MTPTNQPQSTHKPTVEMASIQRHRLLVAAMGVAEEATRIRQPEWSLTVAQVISRASVSRRAFYDLFDNIEECMAEAFELCVGQLRGVVERAIEGEDNWLAALRFGVSAAIHFLDREPLIAYMLLVHSAAGGPEFLWRREAWMLEVARDIYRRSPHAQAPEMIERNAGSIAAVLSVGTRAVLTEEPLLDAYRPAVELLMTAVVPTSGTYAKLAPPPGWLAALEPLAISAVRDAGPRLTSRTVTVLRAIAAQPGRSNKEIAAAVGIRDQGQISKIMSRLQRHGIAMNNGENTPSYQRGAPNAWHLTERGERLEQGLRER